MKKIFFMFLFFTYLLSGSGFTEKNAKREVNIKPNVQSVDIEFNGEHLKGYFFIVDVRTNEEKLKNIEERKANGSVFIFFQGHAQRADDAYTFTKELALQSKSGIVIVPLCDTPFGKDKNLRGDNGKEIVLFYLIKQALKYLNMNVVEDIQWKDIKIDRKPFKDPENAIDVKLSAVGWSHGGILARRMASKYISFENLVQICPAGFTEWPDNSCQASCCVLSSFSWESIRIGFTETFKGYFCDVMGAGWGITKGLTGDTVRSCYSCMYGNFNILKIFRPYKDIADATLYADDTNFPVVNKKHILVIFGKDDSLFDDETLLKYDKNNEAIKEQFFSKYYEKSIISNTKLDVKVLPGKHIGPITHYDIYVDTIVTFLEEIHE
ncbi:MAG: hypothetical protein WBK20_13770 [Spirochaetota bacterium]